VSQCGNYFSANPVVIAISIAHGLFGVARKNQCLSVGSYGRESQLQLYVHPTLVSIARDEVVVVTVFLGSRMSDDMIEEGAKHEIWYAGGSVPEDVEGGTFVRQYMTKDVLGRMVTVHDTQSFTFPVSELDAEINRYLDRLIEWMSCTSTNTCE